MSLNNILFPLSFPILLTELSLREEKNPAVRTKFVKKIFNSAASHHDFRYPLSDFRNFFKNKRSHSPGLRV
jgi:hypothetical protein